MAFVVDRLLPSDLEAGLRLSTQAGWNQVEADWKRVLDLCPDGVFAGRLDGRVVATASVAAFGRDAVWIGLILVDEAQRGRGYGATMFQRAIEKAREFAQDAVGLDASDLGRPVYLKKGFVDVAPIDRWSGILKQPATAPPLDSLTLSNLEAVCDLDRKACGADRSRLLRHMIDDPAIRGFGSPGEGYAMLSPGRLQAHLGPLIAGDDALFETLLHHAARLLKGAEVVVDALRTPSTSAILEAHGLRIVRQLTRMTLLRSQPLLMGPSTRAAVSFTWG
jgi:GNAT superfamily N-acetyltransferase